MAARRQSAAGSAGHPLVESLVRLAGTADDESGIDDQLVGIARLVAEQVASVSYASVTAHRRGAFTTVAASSEIAVAVDEAQYADKLGPCLDVFEVEGPVAVPDIGVAMRWPGFRETAYRLGLRASLSVPLFAGRGTPVAALNLYGHDPAAMALLTTAVWAAYNAHEPGVGDSRQETEETDRGSADLVAGLAEAFAIRALIQRAIGIVMAVDHLSVEQAYVALRLRALRGGASLPDTATGLITETERRSAVHGPADGDPAPPGDDAGLD